MSCPICGKAVAPACRPFCSRRCADIDLGRWLTGSYRIPAETVDAGDDTPPPDTDTDPPPKAH